MESYISEALANGTIRPSTSPLGAGFFFVAKKDGSLRPCIDYRSLNQITVKDKYPLPLLSSTFEPVQDATVFTRLDLRNAYHLVLIRQGDEWKTAFKTPLGHFEYLVMPFGLSNAPAVFQRLVNAVLGDYVNDFVTVYLDEAEVAFRTLKKKFTEAPVLTRPDPSQQFTVEVDASDTGVGAVLSQVSPVDHRLHPCAFFSRRLTPTESRYDVGDRELLAVKLALEEWRHWLEGAEHPFVIWTDHKNLTYLKEAKRLNPRQYRWSLFFTRFNFVFSYRPGSKNIKPAALSRQYSSEDYPVPSTILPPSCVVAGVTWEIRDRVLEALRVDPGPGNGPSNRLFVPQVMRGKVIHWAHTGKFSIHPGVSRTLALIKRSFWWPSIYKDVKEYVLACHVCAQHKGNNRSPAGLLCPLPVLSRPWSHIALDFVCGLPASRGFNTILTIVDRFSKACHLVPLKSLPSSAITAQLLIKHVFRLHGIPEEILSDRGPQFISRVWKEFSNALGALVALTSGFHPQTNGQCERMNKELGAMLRCVCATNPPLGATTWPGWSIPTTAMRPQPQVSLPSKLLLATNPLCFPTSQTPPSLRHSFSAGHVELGRLPEPHFYALLNGTGSWRIVIAARHQPTLLDRWSGCPPGMYLLKPHPRNLLPGF
uniref:Gypsy retrotransposon integrase-like protein 1 n=1 Tax=Nothobranchius kuhntae TaxID=321403 RepID=A0A1A8HXK5_NOTKU